MDKINRYCSRCSAHTEHWMGSGKCVECEQRDQGDAEASILGCSVTIALIFMAVCAVVFLLLNAVTLSFMLIAQPWGLAGSILLVRWLWRRDSLAAEPPWLRYGVTGFLVVFVGLLIIALTRTIFALQIVVLLKELVFFTLPGAAAGWAFASFSGRFRAKLWPIFAGICLAHTLGKLTILGWIAGRF